MKQFLQNIADDQVLTIKLLIIVKSMNGVEFRNIMGSYGFESYSLEEFMVWWSECEYGLNISQASCIMTMDELLDQYCREGKHDYIEGILKGDESTFHKVKQENPKLRDDIGCDYDWFLVYINDQYNLRYLFKMNGVEFPLDE